MKKTIFVVEDDNALLEVLTLLFNANEFNVITASNYSQAVKLSSKKNFDLIVLDWMIPGGSGIQFIQYIKKTTELNMIPIIMLTAKHHESDQVIGLNSGADDYVTKPFSNKELIARIHALIRRTYPSIDHILHFSTLQLDTKAQRLTSGTGDINLAPTEYRLLHFFMSKPEQVFSRNQLIDHVWGHDVYIDDRTVDVHIGRLRKQLEKHGHNNLIQTVRGSGYRLSLRSSTHSVNK